MIMYDVKNNVKNLRLEIHENDEIAYLEYRYYKKDIAFMHTVVPKILEGKGIASALAKYAFEFAKQEKKLVMVYCPFVGSYLKKHPELREQLDKQYSK
ncbi:GNAT family N-acetyltransferase [Pedobacter gandavensis]|uniref:GNAT family N-acetyltransferase n=1 Tax=Pedobacter gandavensis TaxID=2679963 RepID=UPI00293143F3|nr:GNAT family N-acetyltransferase [Pedobacter gandavensis]